LRNARIGFVVPAVIFGMFFVVFFAAVLQGCRGGAKPPAPTVQPIIGPLSLLLPKRVKIHPFTGTRTFEEHGGVKGIIVRIQLMDSYDDPIKGFGDFRFELYEFRPYSQNPKGKKIAIWEESLMQPKKNLLHWDKITRAYKFKLQRNSEMPQGNKYVLVAVFSSPYSERLFAERQFAAGQ